MLELSSTNSCSPSSSPRNSPNKLQLNGPESHSKHFLPMINLSLNEASKSFNFLSQSSSPLRALHSMADLSCKLNLSPPTLVESPSYHSASLNMKSSLGQVASPSSSSSSPIPCSMSTSSTSHYISDILNRPPSFTASTVAGSVLSGTLPRFPLGPVPSSVCFTAAANGLSHKIGSLNDLQSRHLYWPSMVQSSNLWKERLATAGNETLILL